MDAVFDSVSVATTFSDEAGGGGRHLLLLLRGGAEAPRAGGEVPGHGRALHGQLLRDPQLRGLLRRLLLLHPQGRALPDGAVDLLPHQRRQHRAVRADADRRRRGRLRELPRGLHRPHPRREPAPRRGGRAGRPRRTRRSSTRPSRTGTRATRTARAASTTSSPSAASARGANSKISWTQVETGSAITWKYPCCILQGDDSVGEFYSVAVTNNTQQADTGTKMIHIGKNTQSTIVSKGISAGHGQNTYRGLVQDRQGRRRRAQLLAVRLAAHRRQVRRPHLPLHRRAELHRPDGARGHHLQDRRGPALLLPAARHRQPRTRST